MAASFWSELNELLEPDFTGQIVLHCKDGKVGHYDVSERRKPLSPQVELSEVLDRSGE